MKNNLSSLNFSYCFCNKNLRFGDFETTYKIAYGNFYGESNNLKNNNIERNRNTNLKHQYLLLNQTEYNKKMPNTKLICPNCINQNIVKERSHSRIRRSIQSKFGDGVFEDKMKSLYEKKLKKDIKKRDDNSKKTYHSLFINRGRSNENYKKLYETNKNINKDGEYFGKDIEYGMLRCRNRELKNDKKIYGIDLKKRSINNKSWIGHNYLLDKTEYSEIINKQIEKDNKKKENERNLKLRQEKKLLLEQLQNEKNKIEVEKENKNNIRNEMNRINSLLLNEKKIKERNEIKKKRIEKECISNICKQQIEEFVQNLKLKKLKNKNIDDENKKTAQTKNKLIKNKIDKNIYGLALKETEKKKCQQCKRKYPKNVMSQIFYLYNEQQKK